MVRGLRESLDDAKFKGWEMPVTQISGIHLLVPQLVSLLQFDTVKDYEDLITRYRKLPTAFDQTIEHMRAGMKDGLMPPKFLLGKIAEQADAIAKGKPLIAKFGSYNETEPVGGHGLQKPAH